MFMICIMQRAAEQDA